jgi:hypothetical protein
MAVHPLGKAACLRRRPIDDELNLVVEAQTHRTDNDRICTTRDEIRSAATTNKNLMTGGTS